MAVKPTILLVGAGSMGGALFRGWIDLEAIHADSVLIDPSLGKSTSLLCEQAGIEIYPTVRDVSSSSSFDVIIFAVKPQLADKILPDYAGFAATSVSVSVMAGKSVGAISRLLNGADKIIRTMPNLPASVGAGMTGLYATPSVSKAEQTIVATLMRGVGEIAWVKDEAQIDFVTAISGSGPAYYFLLTEALCEAAIEIGFDKETADRLARQTAIGAGRLLEADERHAAELRIAVTSPGGTTAAALAILDSDNGFRKLLKQAVKKAAIRAGELST